MIHSTDLGIINERTERALALSVFYFDICAYKKITM